MTLARDSLPRRIPRSRSRISFEIIGSRRPKIHPVIDGQKVISHRARQRVILHGGKGEGFVPAIATGVAVTGACNDHSPLSSRHRDSLSATSKTTPSLPPTRENVYGERHVRSMRRKDVVGVRVYARVRRIRSDRYVGLWGIFVCAFLLLCYPRFTHLDRKLTERAFAYLALSY